MSLGNYAYIVYIALVSAIVLLLWVGYVVWKRRVMRGLMQRGDIRAALIHGSDRIARAKELLVIAAIIVAGIALLLPQWGELAREVKNEGSDVLIALDVSRSMLAQDVKPSRLDRAKDAVRWIASSLKGDRIGLVLFAGDAFLQCPLTNDIGAFLMFLDAAGPDAIPKQGTDIGRALMEGYRVFEQKRLTSRLFVLITDGEDHEGAISAAISRFRDLNVSVYTVGVGRDNGDFIPAQKDESTADNYYRDAGGKLIRTRRNTDVLKQIAGHTLGSYIDISDNLSGLGFIMEVIADQQKNQYGSRIIKEKQQQFHWFALALIALLALELLLAERRPLREPGRRRPFAESRPVRWIREGLSRFRRGGPLPAAATKNGIAILLLLIGAASIAWLDPYRDEVSRGNGAYNDKKYEDAKKSYRKAERYAPATRDKQRLSFNKGDADYMLGDYDNAMTLYQQAVQSGDREVQKKAFFNMGNAYMKQGKYREAVQSFINALKIDPQYGNAKKNLEYLLQNKPPEQQQNGNDQKRGDQKDQKKQQEQKNKDAGKQKQDEKQKQQQDGNRQQRAKMDRNQLKNILDSMKQKPVRRGKANAGGEDQLEKNW